jgi:HK97 family phage prohead protease
MSTTDQTNPAVDVADGIARREYAAHITARDGRNVDVCIVPYGERIVHNDGLGFVPKGVDYVEEIMPGCFDHQVKAAHRVVANFEHEQGIAGVIARGTALRSAADGFHGTFRMLNNASGDAALELINEGVLDSVSFEARFRKNVRSVEGVVQRIKADLLAVAFTRFGAYSGAKVLAVREQATAQMIDERYLPLDMDPKLVERLRASPIVLPDRYRAHPDMTDTSANADTSEDGTRQTDANTTSLEEQ